jgi:DNA-binding response OmpR family regulator
MARVVVAEDEEPIAQLLRERLERSGHQVVVVFDGEAALVACRRLQPELVVLDVMLPRRDGLEVCRELRRQGGRQPVILMLTARTAEQDALEGFESGADDYVRKPFGVAELTRRIHALLALSHRRDGAVEPLRTGGLVIDPGAREVLVGTNRVRLTPKEFDLLVHLAQRPLEVHERERILEAVWGYRHAGYARTVDSHVTRVRKKLAAAGLVADPITTVHGVGYAFAPRTEGP